MLHHERPFSERLKTLLSGRLAQVLYLTLFVSFLEVLGQPDPWLEFISLLCVNTILVYLATWLAGEIGVVALLLIDEWSVVLGQQKRPLRQRHMASLLRLPL